MARRKQQSFTGMEATTLPDLSQAAEEYQEAKESRQNWLKEEIKRKDKLIGLMKEHGLVTYKDHEFIVTYTAKAKENIKVKAVSDGSEEDED